MANEVVPFGKYQGRSFKAMVKDRKYVDWLLAQPWFREQFGEWYSLITTHYQEPTETPEHNAFQVKFLDPNFQRTFLERVQRKVPEQYAKFLKVDFESHGFDVHFHCRFPSDDPHMTYDHSCLELFVECKPTVADEYPAVLRQMKKAISGWAHARNNSVLVLGEYQGVGATREQFVRIFYNAGIPVVFLHEIEESVALCEFFNFGVDSPSSRE
jgi:uncharacterized protein (DUF3820 family)